MSNSKTNKSHKERVQKFKQKHKTMSEKAQINIPQSPIIDQFPVWSSDAAIQMSGIEWEAIYNVINFFRNGVLAAESVMQKNIQNGTIKWVYKDKDGKDVDPAIVQAYQEEVAAFFKAQQAAKPITAEEQEDLPRIDAIVDPSGNPLKAI